MIQFGATWFECASPHIHIAPRVSPRTHAVLGEIIFVIYTIKFRCGEFVLRLET